MRVFVDANVLLDVILKRELFYKESKEFLDLCSKRKTALAPHTVTNVFYQMREKFKEPDRKPILLEILSYMDVVTTGKHHIIKALSNGDIDDFEDAFQLECAREYNADCIVTRDFENFVGSEINTMTPGEFLKKHGREFAADDGMKTLANEGGK